jgi:hypothetical protein
VVRNLRAPPTLREVSTDLVSKDAQICDSCSSKVFKVVAQVGRCSFFAFATIPGIKDGVSAIEAFCDGRWDYSSSRSEFSVKMASLPKISLGVFAT